MPRAGKPIPTAGKPIPTAGKPKDASPMGIQHSLILRDESKSQGNPKTGGFMANFIIFSRNLSVMKNIVLKKWVFRAGCITSGIVSVPSRLQGEYRDLLQAFEFGKRVQASFGKSRYKTSRHATLFTPQLCYAFV